MLNDWNKNSLYDISSQKTKREKLISKVDRDLRKIWHFLNLKDPLRNMLEDLSKKTKHKYNWLNDLDDVSLEWLSNNLTILIFEMCEKVKNDVNKIIK